MPDLESDSNGVWPPVYDAERLADEIQDLVQDLSPSRFFGSLIGPHVCQGDIVKLRSKIPLISETGAPVAEDETEYWLVIGNTCDFDRNPDDVPFTQIVPIAEFEGLSPSQRNAAVNYLPSRSFYIPSWKATLDSKILIANFCKPVTVYKKAIEAVGQVEARLTHSAWALLHSCLIRFFCRDDRRFI